MSVKKPSDWKEYNPDEGRVQDTDSWFAAYPNLRVHPRYSGNSSYGVNPTPGGQKRYRNRPK